MKREIPRAKYQPVRASKQMAKKIVAVHKQLNAELNLQIDILYHAAALALHRFHGWSTDEIIAFFKEGELAGQECGRDFETSMIEMCWEELGIELMAEGIEKHWYEVSFLDSEQDMDRIKMDQFKMYEFYKAQLPWVATQITASILLSLHRAAGWKEKACGEFIKELENIKYDYNKDAEKLRNQCSEECGAILSEDFWVING